MPPEGTTPERVKPHVFGLRLAELFLDPASRLPGVTSVVGYVGQMLSRLSDEHGRFTRSMTALAAACHSTPQTVTRVVHAFETAGLLRRTAAHDPWTSTPATYVLTWPSGAPRCEIALLLSAACTGDRQRAHRARQALLADLAGLDGPATDIPPPASPDREGRRQAGPHLPLPGQRGPSPHGPGALPVPGQGSSCPVVLELPEMAEPGETVTAPRARTHPRAARQGNVRL
ncbi:hypothetical protein [Kitasatospora sp. NPDC057223]|uniref:hypothetical protein n=1 Tax=Kitasatospora sp. NPDC057223 TaxID=3346055 RepID=UPI00363A00F7